MSAINGNHDIAAIKEMFSDIKAKLPTSDSGLDSLERKAQSVAVATQMSNDDSYPSNGDIFTVSGSNSWLSTSPNDIEAGTELAMVGENIEGERAGFTGTVTGSEEDGYSVKLTSADAPNTSHSMTFAPSGEVESASTTRTGSAGDLLTEEELRMSDLDANDTVSVTRTMEANDDGTTTSSVAVNLGDLGPAVSAHSGEFTASDAYNSEGSALLITDINQGVLRPSDDPSSFIMGFSESQQPEVKTYEDTIGIQVQKRE